MNRLMKHISTSRFKRIIQECLNGFVTIQILLGIESGSFKIHKYGSIGQQAYPA